MGVSDTQLGVWDTAHVRSEKADGVDEMVA
jgi:hypothetical protein